MCLLSFFALLCSLFYISFLIFSINDKSAGNQSTLSRFSFVSHLATSCSLSTKSPDLILQITATLCSKYFLLLNNNCCNYSDCFHFHCPSSVVLFCLVVRALYTKSSSMFNSYFLSKPRINEIQSYAEYPVLM